MKEFFESDETHMLFPDWDNAGKVSKSELMKISEFFKGIDKDWLMKKIKDGTATKEDYIKYEEFLYKSVGLSNKKSKLREETNEIH